MPALWRVSARFEVSDMIDRVDKVFCIVSKVFIIGSAAAIGVMASLVTLSTLMRYAIGNALTFTEDLASFLLVACMFLAFPYAALEGKHIRLTFVTSRLSARVSVFFGIATSLAAFFYLSISYSFIN